MVFHWSVGNRTAAATDIIYRPNLTFWTALTFYTDNYYKILRYLSLIYYHKQKYIDNAGMGSSIGGFRDRVVP